MIKLAEYDFVKKNGYLQAPKVVQIEITNRCPLNCPQCYKDIRVKDMNLDLLKDIINDLIVNDVKSVMLNGGETLAYPHLTEMISMLEQANIKAETFISGAYLDDNMINILKHHKLNVNVSLNGSNEEINSISRDGYDLAINAIRKFYLNKIPFGINWVARHDNIHDFPNIIEIAVKNNATNILIVGNKINHMGYLSSPLTKEDYFILKNLIEQFRSKITINVQRCFTFLSGLFIQSKNRLIDGCLAGIISCTINVDGDYMPCSHLQYLEKYTSISDYWNNSIVLKSLRSHRTNTFKECADCRKCDYCYFCRALSEDTRDNFNIGPKECIMKEI